MYDLILRNAIVVDPLNGINSINDVAIENGKIAEVKPDIATKAKEEVDLTGLHLQPGIVDSHVHLGSMWGSPYGPAMLAHSGVTTCLDMAGPLEDILTAVPKYGTGLNMAILQMASPPFTLKSSSPTQQEMDELIDQSLESGALGIKLLGGHYPLEPVTSALLIKAARDRRAYVGWHAGSTKHGSNIEGMAEAVAMADGYPLHLAHINAYCRGAVHDDMEECQMAIDLLTANPNILCESYLSPKNGTRLTCNEDGTIQSKVTGNCLRHFGYPENKKGVEQALLAGKAYVIYDAGDSSNLMTGEGAVKLWKAANTDVGGSFDINPPLPRLKLAYAKRKEGSFVVDAISTDGGCIPRNVILALGLSLVKLGLLSLPEFVQKSSLNPARMLRLKHKGHLSIGADADITIFDFQRQIPISSLVNGKKILWKGKVVGKGTTVICTKRGKRTLERQNLRTIVVDPGEPYERLKAVF